LTLSHVFFFSALVLAYRSSVYEFSICRRVFLPVSFHQNLDRRGGTYAIPAETCITTSMPTSRSLLALANDSRPMPGPMRASSACQAGDVRIISSKQLLSKSAEILRAFASQLSEICAQASIASVQNTRAFRAALQAAHSGSMGHAPHRKELQQQKASQRTAFMDSAIAQTKSRCATLRESTCMRKLDSRVCCCALYQGRSHGLPRGVRGCGLF
jgi:hypothetical protein